MIRPGGLKLTEIALQIWQLPRGSSVLDIGCGCGETVEYLGSRHGLNACGLDASEELINEGLARNPSLQLTRGDGENLRELPSETFEGVLLECVLSIFANPAKVLGEVRRILAPGGKLFISDLHVVGSDGDLGINESASGQLFLKEPTEERKSVNGANEAITCISCRRFKLDALCACLLQIGFGSLRVEDWTEELDVYVATKIMRDGNMSGCFFDGALTRAEKRRTGYFALTAEKS